MIDKNPNINTNPVVDYWTIPKVNYRQKVVTVHLAKELLDSGNTKNQDGWAEYRNFAEQKGEFYTGDLPLYHSILTAVFTQRANKKESEEIRQFILEKTAPLDKVPLTLTRVAYQPKCKDKIIHNYNTQEEYTLEENMIGKTSCLVDSLRNSQLKALLGVGAKMIGLEKIFSIRWGFEKILDPYWYICGEPKNLDFIHFERLISKPDKVDERVARIAMRKEKAGIFCISPPNSLFTSLGVRVVS